ncbi:toll/interleukin-1 receptor domain-containing protein [Qipengyuania sp. 6B39]|uniref:toll/interleukin-1 receptor domain-containing protein n=1 Tax=Qipengyuania proteolytica TaxID=2867239 RepID=UPI001C8AA32B|nr:toll/interleukin-1 receptor domain-containing protein [Qipengyuania proteolytica]MBX7494903.1 toll/interleukin-1 receptor domain-containing protein [Qipengyuania proteolytica]
MMKAFISYCHTDETILDKLHKHLAQLRRDGTIDTWYDREILAGGRFDSEISAQLADADIFLACASPDWIASNYAYEQEFEKAIERELDGSMRIVPVIFRPCDWLATPLAKFTALPKDGKAITEFTNQDVAFLEVAQKLRRLCAEARKSSKVITEVGENSLEKAEGYKPPRYRAKREFDAVDRRDFIEQSYEEVFRFFEASAAEIANLDSVECRLTRSERHFSCTVINRGYGRAFETVHIRQGGMFGGINVQYGERFEENVSHGGFSVKSDEYQLFWSGGGFAHMYGDQSGLMTARDLAQQIWDDLLAKVGITYAKDD